VENIQFPIMEVALHMLKRYSEVMLMLDELGARAGKLNNSDRNELQSLLEEQAWLGSTMVKKAKSVLEEIDDSFEKLFDWMVDVSDLIDHVASAAGTPEDLLALENIMGDVVKIRDQVKQLNLDKRVNNVVTKRVGNLLTDSRLEAAPTAATLLVDEDPTVVANNLVDDQANISPDDTRAIEPLALVAAKQGEQVQNKSHPKKDKKAKCLAGNSYQPPQELLVSIAEKISPQTQHRLVEQARQFIPLNRANPKRK